MVEGFFQRKGVILLPFSEQTEKDLLDFKEYQTIRAQLYGFLKERSVLQNNWIHAIFEITAQNNDDPNWQTKEAVKKKVKLAMKFFKDDPIVSGSMVFFELRSFAFHKMKHREANIVYEHAKNICAAKMGVDPDILEAEAKKRSRLNK